MAMAGICLSANLVSQIKRPNLLNGILFQVEMYSVS